MLQFTIRIKEKFFTEFEQYARYPFDRLEFKYRFELSHFELQEDTFRFDYYRTMVNELSWKPNCDFLPEFDIDYPSTSLTTLIEKKPYKVNKKDTDEKGNKYMAYYYPGFTLAFTCIRNPKSKMIKVFFPSLMLIIFLLCTYRLDVDGLPDKIGNLSIVLLTFVEILDKNRSELPSI